MKWYKIIDLTLGTPIYIGKDKIKAYREMTHPNKNLYQIYKSDICEFGPWYQISYSEFMKEKI